MDEEATTPQPASASEELTRTLDGARAFIQTLPPFERKIAMLAADGASVWEIAQRTETSEAAVSRTLSSVIAAITGRDVAQVEVGGVGADTDPGISGGYGDTGFGSLDTDLLPDNTEPDEGG